jgi:hypothetical protein
LAKYCESLQAEEVAAVDADLADDCPDLPAADLSEANLPPAVEKAPLLCNHSQIMGVDHHYVDLLEVEEHHECGHSNQHSLA